MLVSGIICVMLFMIMKICSVIIDVRLVVSSFENELLVSIVVLKLCLVNSR